MRSVLIILIEMVRLTNVERTIQWEGDSGILKMEKVRETFIIFFVWT